jgi:hypothetical protein
MYNPDGNFLFFFNFREDGRGCTGPYLNSIYNIRVEQRIVERFKCFEGKKVL